MNLFVLHFTLKINMDTNKYKTNTKPYTNKYTLFTINFGAINFGDIIFGEISTIHRISIEIRSLKIFGATNFWLGTSSPKLFHTEIYSK